MMRKRKSCLLLLFILLTITICNSKLAAPYFDEGENLSVENCGVWDKSGCEQNNWMAYVDYGNFSCLGVVISSRSILTDGCRYLPSGVAKNQGKIYVGECANNHNATECNGKHLKLLDIIQMSNYPIFDLYITEKMPILVRPICLFNRGSEMDLTGQQDSPYFEWDRSQNTSINCSHIYWQDTLSPRTIVPMSQCLSASARTEDNEGKKLPSRSWYICASSLHFKQYGSILVNYHNGRYFLRGFNEDLFSRADGFNDKKFNLYYDVLPHTEWIKQHAKGISALSPTPSQKLTRAFNGDLSFPNCGKKLGLGRRRRETTVHDTEETAPTHYVFSGYEAKIGQHPWHANIKINIRDSFCGGTLISRKVVLTAAKCIFGNSADTFEVSIGSHDRIQKNTAGIQIKTPSRVITHPNFTFNQFQYDVGLLIFDDEFDVTEKVRPICLWNEDSDLDHVTGKLAVVVGFGLMDNYTLPDVLQEANLRIISHQECYLQNRRFFGKYLRPGDNFCAGYLNGTSVCSGDSGGSLTVERNGQWFIRGIVSFGMSKKVLIEGSEQIFCNPNSYNLFVDVGAYVDWIVENTPDISFR
ncbi:plasminogen-like [Cloeon dipterum]|uniref:plasminogen-like n=1 Tax=Cloeon dipterum TaxID=197152 RepID=UPI00321FEF40